uniref:Serpentine receptor class gamma n=1 Tax=Panagrellus redivivus TaxID=6233 RepID=A0A7E4WAN1_PANRE
MKELRGRHFTGQSPLAIGLELLLRLWNGKFYAFFVILVLLFPLLCNGYTLITNPTCRIYFYSIDCYDFQIQNTIDAAIVTICMSLLAFLIANYGFIQARKSKKLSKASRLLVTQTIVTATFQALCSAFFAHSALTERDDVYFWEAVSAMFSFLQHYPSVVLLFFVSQSVRQDYYKFYRLKCLIHKDRGITLVSPATFMPGSPRAHHDFAVTQVL